MSVEWHTSKCRDCGEKRDWAWRDGELVEVCVWCEEYGKPGEGSDEVD